MPGYEPSVGFQVSVLYAGAGEGVTIGLGLGEPVAADTAVALGEAEGLSVAVADKAGVGVIPDILPCPAW